jgi:hypothetical protein
MDITFKEDDYMKQRQKTVAKQLGAAKSRIYPVRALEREINGHDAKTGSLVLVSWNQGLHLRQVL